MGFKMHIFEGAIGLYCIIILCMFIILNCLEAQQKGGGINI